MYSYIKGNLVEKNEGGIIVENAGIGYELSMSKSSLMTLEIDTEITVYTRLIVKEDEFSLCAFASKEERSLFDYLTSVSGVGKRYALGALSSADAETIIRWIITEDTKSLMKLPGIGKKTSERLVIELRDKFKKLYGDLKSEDIISSEGETDKSLHEDIVLALTGLGFNRSEINNMCAGMPLEIDVEGAIKYALKNRNSR